MLQHEGNKCELGDTRPLGFRQVAAPPPPAPSAPSPTVPASDASPGAAVIDPLVSSVSERTVLSTLLQDDRKGLASQIGSVLSAADFGEEVHANLFRLWQTLNQVGQAHDLAALIDASLSHNLFTGGEDYLINLATNATYQTASDEAVQAAATRIKELSGIRTLLASTKLIAERAATGQASSRCSPRCSRTRRAMRVRAPSRRAQGLNTSPATSPWCWKRWSAVWMVR